MSKTITISNIKGIKKLVFNFPEKNGVYLVVGPNGAGKTTLLICMDRICNSLSFAHGFYQPKNIKGYDEYVHSEIKYDVDKACVLFRKKNSRWASSPKMGSADLLGEFGFTNSVFIRADSRRIDPSSGEIEKGRVEGADSTLIMRMNEIFETDKYTRLKVLKVTHGRGKTPTYFNIIQSGKSYYTEKRFSTGEIAI